MLHKHSDIDLVLIHSAVNLKKNEFIFLSILNVSYFFIKSEHNMKCTTAMYLNNLAPIVIKKLFWRHIASNCGCYQKLPAATLKIFLLLNLIN